MSIPAGTAQNVGGEYVWELELGVWEAKEGIAAFTYELWSYREAPC